MMKKYLFLSLLIAIGAFSSCEKESSTLEKVSVYEDDSISNSIIGEWELRSSVSGLTGKITDYPLGNGTTLKFAENSYETFSHGELTYSGVYMVIQDSSILDNKFHDRIIYDNRVGAIRSFFTIDSNRLSTWIDAYDGPSATYIRIKKH